LDHLYKYAVAAILIFIPLYPKFPLFTVPFTYVAIRSEDFLIALVWAIFFAKLFFERKIKLPKITFQIGVYFAVALVSCISAILITKNVQPLIVILHFFRRIEYLSVFFLVYWAGKTVPLRRFFLELSILPAIGVLLYGLAQIYLGAPVISTMDAEASKGIALTLRPGVSLSSTFAGHYDLAVYLTMMIVFLVAFASSTKKFIKQIPIFLFFSAMIWLFMQAGSRISLLGLGLGICAVAYFYKRYFLGLIFLIITFAFIATSAQYISRFKSIFNVITTKFSYVTPRTVYAASAPTPTPTPTPEPLRLIQQDRSTSIRFDVEWPRAIRAFKKNPLLGTGFSSITLATDNDYLRAIGETGLLGFLAFSSLLLSIFLSLLKLIKTAENQDKIIVVSAMGIFIAFLTTAMFIDVFESSKVAILFWAFMGLALSTKQS